MSASGTARAGQAGEAGWAGLVCRGLAALGCHEIVYVPDNPLSHVLKALADHPDIRTTVATREEEAFGIAAGLYLGGARPAVMLQSSGLGNSINALASLNVAFEIPVLMLVTMRGGDGEWNPTQHPMGRAVRPILESLGIPHATIEAADRAEKTVRQLGEQAFAVRRPGACLLARSLWGSVSPVLPVLPVPPVPPVLPVLPVLPVPPVPSVMPAR
jgi:sulfopyruvate decarboxylase subunit alpha